MRTLSRIWENEVCYIVGGGPSLKDFEWRRLIGKNVIAINRALEVLPFVDVIFFSDLRFWKQYRQSILAHKAEYKVTFCKEAYEDAPEDLTYLKNEKRYGLESDITKICDGKNSGYAAMNLAAHLGASLIVLLGYDMKEKGDNTHWHSGYTEGYAERKLKAYNEAFKSIVNPLKDLNINVLNACEDSDLEYWSKATLESVCP